MSFGELCVLLIVAVLVFGPQELPKVLRKAGMWAGKIRRFAYDMRTQSGIDDVLRSEGLDREIAEIRKLARGEIDGVVAATRSVSHMARFDDEPRDRDAQHTASRDVDRDREYPRDGADAYGAMSDTAGVYMEGLPKSAWADDSVYARGEERGEEEDSTRTSTAAPAPELLPSEEA